MYTAELLRLIECHDLHPHGYADDTQIYGFYCWSNTYSANRSHGDLFIYLGLSAAAHTQLGRGSKRRLSNGRSAVES